MPVWNHEIACAACFWTAAGGRDQAVFDALASGRVDQLRLDEPVDRNALHDELMIERDVGRLHLADVVERFYDRQWRREHTPDGIHPDDHLWWATAGYLDLDNALRDTGR